MTAREQLNEYIEQLERRLRVRALLRGAALAFVGALVLVVSAKVEVPFYPVPMTLQTLAVLTLGALFGARLATATVALYLGEGLIGLPVFAGAADLALIDDDVLALWRGKTGTDSQQSSVVGQSREPAKPYGPWWYAMLLVLVAALGESFLAARYLTPRTEEP